MGENYNRVYKKCQFRDFTMDKKRTHKVVFLGDTGVGKTTLINTFYKQGFILNESSTISPMSTNLVVKHEDTDVSLSIWDTAGQERYRSLSINYIRDSSVLVFVYAVTSEYSFLELDPMIENALSITGNAPKVFIVGNKIDLEANQVVDNEQAQELALKYNACILYTSAVLMINTEGLLKVIAKAAYENFSPPIKEDNALVFKPNKDNCC